MDVDFICMVAIGVGILLLVVGFVVKRITKRKVVDLEGFVGILIRETRRAGMSAMAKREGGLFIPRGYQLLCVNR